MRVAPVSADLLVKLALGAAVIGAGWWAVQRAAAAVQQLPTLIPWDPLNPIYAGVNGIGGTIVTDPEGPGKNADGSWTLGGWVYDVTHPGAFDFQGGGATGSW